MNMRQTKDNPSYFIIHDGVKHAMGKDCPVCEQILTERLREASRKGGMSRWTTGGKEVYSQMGKKGSQGLKDKYGPEYFMKLSAAGVTARNKRRKIKELEEELERLKDSIN